MRAARTAVVAWAWASALTAAPALAQAAAPCEAAALPGPLPIGPEVADFGEIGTVCPTDAIDARLRGAAAIDTPDFYGNVAGGLTLRGVRRLGGRWSASAAVDAPTFRFVANAVVESTGWSAGPATLGVARTFGGGAGRTAGLVGAQALLPLETARRSSARAGLALVAGGRHALRPWLALQGGLALPATWTISGGRGRAGLVPGLVAEAALAPAAAFAFSVGAALRGEAAPAPALLALAPRAAVALRTRGGFVYALAAELALAGAARTDLVAAFTVGWRRF